MRKRSPKDVEILRRERDEALFGQADGELVIGGAFDLGVGDVLRPALQAVLADDDGAFFPVLDPLGQEQDAVGDHVGEDVHDDLVAGELGFVVDPSRADVRGQGGQVEPADHVVGEKLAVGLDRFREGVERGEVELLHELAADVGALDQELLVVAVELVELTGCWRALMSRPCHAERIRPSPSESA